MCAHARLAGRHAALLCRRLSPGGCRRRRPRRALAPGADAAAISINLTDLLAKEPELPLPVRQRAEGLDAYYQENGGKLLWLGTGRIADFMLACVRPRTTASILRPIPRRSSPSSRRGGARHRRARPRDDRALLLLGVPRIRLRPAGRPLPAPQGRSELLPAGQDPSTSWRRSPASPRPPISTPSSMAGSRRAPTMPS